MSLNWNFKLWVAVGAVIVLLSASGIVLSTNESDKESVSILARVNNEGSGIFVRDTPDAANMIQTVDGVVTVTNSELWEGKVFMTPGPASIQHMILMQIVKEDLGLNFVQYGSSVSNAVYFLAVAPGQMLTRMDNTEIFGGIAWEPHYANAVASGLCIELMTTGEYWEGHPCCVIAANNSFLSGNQNATERFLAAYVLSVKWVTEAISETSANHQDLIDITMSIGFPDSSSTTEADKIAKIAIVKAALANISYVYDIGNLPQQLAEVVETYEQLKLVEGSTLTDAGYETPLDFTEHLVQGQYLSGVLDEGGNVKSAEELGYYGKEGLTHIGVAYLAADIHQIALHVGMMDGGYFAQYGISIKLIGPFGAGGDVMNALLSGQASIGFVGSPPVVSSSINALRS